MAFQTNIVIEFMNPFSYCRKCMQLFAASGCFNVRRYYFHVTPFSEALKFEKRELATRNINFDSIYPFNLHWYRFSTKLFVICFQKKLHKELTSCVMKKNQFSAMSSNGTGGLFSVCELSRLKFSVPKYKHKILVL